MTNPFLLAGSSQAVRSGRRATTRWRQGRGLGGDDRQPGGPGRLVGVDLGPEPQREPDVVKALEQAMLGERVEGEAGLDARRRCLQAEAFEVDRDL